MHVIMHVCIYADACKPYIGCIRTRGFVVFVRGHRKGHVLLGVYSLGLGPALFLKQPPRTLGFAA